MDTHAVSRSMVGIRTIIPDDAFTAHSLGTVREGSGVVIREDGLVLTIGYLITEAEEVWITRADGKVVAGHSLAYHQETGLGLVRALGALDSPALMLGDATKVQVGDPAIFADGFGRSLETKIVAKREFAGYWEYLLDEAIFVAPAHPSWGGAAVVGQDGRLLGIGSLKLVMSRNGTSSDINMVVPINLLPPILDDLLARGKVNTPARPWLGAFATESNGDVVVMSVAADGPAAKAGLRGGDIIAEVRDSEIAGLADFYRQVWKSGPAGSEIPVRILRDGREAWLRVKSVDRDSFLKKPQLQ
ncbi:S1C family serine protease [Pararhizobium sp. PWRC1-1]|uniref:S1C family serine protease n=1 Tax=Pararhizobium sp. PWRC1-1 TaxID=2804566 RepID=UPI003CF040C4